MQVSGRTVWFLCAGLILAAMVYAQGFRATILGRVADPSLAAIPGATVTATKKDTNVSRDMVTNVEGMYTLDGLDPGRYIVAITAARFTTVRRSGIVLQVADKLNLPVTMEVGQVTESMTGVGQQNLVKTATASRGLGFDPIKMQEIPINGRTVYRLMQLTPGVMFTQRTFGPTGFSAYGAWAMTNEFTMNGAPISTEGTCNVLPNVDAVEEMKVMVNSYDARYGRSGAGHVSTTLRGGTNRWHGSVVDFSRNRIPDANTRENNAGGGPAWAFSPVELSSWAATIIESEFLN